MICGCDVGREFHDIIIYVGIPDIGGAWHIEDIWDKRSGMGEENYTVGDMVDWCLGGYGGFGVVKR